MLDVDPSQLESAVADLQSQLRDGLVAADILDLTTGISLVGFNANPQSSALFTLMTEQINKMLEGIMYPGLNRYFPPRPSQRPQRRRRTVAGRPAAGDADQQHQDHSRHPAQRRHSESAGDA